MFTPSETEATTAATDALLGLLCLVLAFQLLGTPVPAPWKRNVWVGVLALLSCGSLLGAVAHGLQLSDGARDLIWKPLYLSLGLAVALIVVAAVCDWLGEAAARRLLPWALGAGGLFFGVSQLLGGAFLIFILYEAAAAVTALVIYTSLAVHGGTPGASTTAIGIAISLVAAAVQMSSLSVRLGVRFDHNGLFHLVQIAGVIVVAVGVRASLVKS